MQTEGEVCEGGSERRRFWLVTQHIDTLISFSSLMYWQWYFLRYDAHKTSSLLSNRPNKIPCRTGQLLDLSEVLLNLLIATGFSGAITITLSHSALH